MQWRSAYPALFVCEQVCSIPDTRRRSTTEELENAALVAIRFGYKSAPLKARACVRPEVYMQAFLNDFTGALRQLRQSPGPALLAILTLALGIGANTAVFTVIESVLLRPLPYAHADRLVYIGPKGDKPGFATTSWLNYRDIRDQSKLLSAAAGYSEDVGVLETRDS